VVISLHFDLKGRFMLAQGTRTFFVSRPGYENYLM
jgi:hypothetical protein